MLIVLKKSYIIMIASVIAAAALSIAFFGNSQPANAPAVNPDAFIIDPGHGGMDGGASGQSGVLEKDLNLKVSLYLKDMLEANGKTVIMTRQEDVSLHTTSSAKIRTQKRSDLEFRKKILTENPSHTFVSIHMNKFEESKYKGAQVFYANNDSSRILGEKMQKSLIEGLNDGNTRVAKTIPSDVYIFKNVPSTAVVVECGFLSNAEEEKLLASEEYQKKLAQCIYNALCN